MKKVDLQYFPGWVRKSMTFTIDDGNLTLDRKFLNYTESGGFKGTFNLTTPLRYSAEKQEQQNYYRDFYAGYEIANHCRYHAFPFADDHTVDFKDEPFDIATADKAYVYPTGEKGLYRNFSYAWTYIADDDKYMECVDDCQKELEAIFGKERIKGYVWPCGEQKNKAVFERLKAYGFQSIRKTGCVTDTTGFSMPADRTRWSYNANWTNLNETGAKYDAYPDDGCLKFFCFGVHSHDFENSHSWHVLEEFVNELGNRPKDFFYASVGQIFDYEDAIKSVTVTDSTVRNPSDIDLYIKIDNQAVILPAHSEKSLL